MSLPRVFYEGGSYLVWTGEEFAELRRKAKIIGFPAVTSPWYPTQSDALALPAVLMPEEAIWSLKNGFCRIVKPIFKNSVNPALIVPGFASKHQVMDDPDAYEVLDYDPIIENQLNYRIYEDLKNKGYYVANGENYGFDFNLYEKPPWEDHSKILIWIENDKIDPHMMIQRVRIAESVKKDMVMACIDGEKLKYINIFRRNDEDSASTLIE